MKKIIITILLIAILGYGIFTITQDPISHASETDGLSGYSSYYGEITEVSGDGDNKQVLVNNEEAEEESMDELFLYTKDVPVIDLKTGDLMEDYNFQAGERIHYFFRNDTPMMMSYPGKLSPGLIGVNLDEAKYSLDVDYFDKEGKGISSRLVINVSDDMVAESLDGEVVEDFLGNDLAVLYTVATRSLPPQASPDKVYVLEMLDN